MRAYWKAKEQEIRRYLERTLGAELPPELVRRIQELSQSSEEDPERGAQGG